MAVPKTNVVSEKSLPELMSRISTAFEMYVSQRAQANEQNIDKSYQFADWMYNGGTHRGHFDVNRRKWVPRYVEGKSNIGSLVFHRQVNTLAGMLGAVIYGSDRLWEYTDIETDTSDIARQTGLATAKQMNALAQYVAKLDGLLEKLIEFTVGIFKWSNVFALITVNRKTRRVATLKGLGNDLVPRFSYTERQEIPYPSVEFPYPASVYADACIKNIQDQSCVVVLTPTTRVALHGERKYFDKELYEKVRWENVAWDGALGANPDSNVGSGLDTSSVLRWDAYVHVPMTGNEIDDDNGEDTLLWVTAVGNSPQDIVPIRVVKDFDPDGEIPLQIVRAVPDMSPNLYHPFLSDILLPVYAARCAIANAMIDHDALLVDPPLEILRSAGAREFTYKPGSKWVVDAHGAVRPVDVPGNPLVSLQLANLLEDDMKRALATDPSKMGEYAGARTTAIEIMRVTAATDAAVAIRNSYILSQLLPWLARKYVSYIRQYMPIEVVNGILGEMLYAPPQAKYIGEYDVQVNIVSQHMDDQMRKMMGRELLAMIASNPLLLRSKSHEVDVAKLLKQVLNDARFNTSEIVLDKSSEPEAEMNARNKIQLMLVTGVYQPPQDGEDWAVHARVAKSEVVRWRGISPETDRRAANIQLIEQYAKDCEDRIAQQETAAMAVVASAMAPAAQQSGQASPPGPPREMMESSQPAQEMAGQMGQLSLGA